MVTFHSVTRQVPSENTNPSEDIVTPFFKDLDTFLASQTGGNQIINNRTYRNIKRNLQIALRDAIPLETTLKQSTNHQT